jgi:hypothetical protein
MIARVQEHLETIYHLQGGLSALDFVVDRRTAHALGYTGRSGEELLVREDDGALEVALYLSPELLERLGRCEGAPAHHLLDRHLDAFCQLAEGVSHFLYLTRAAMQGRRVSLLELEIQAEIDKFALCVLSGWRRGARFAEHLFLRLFRWVSFRTGLAIDELWRYQQANRISARYCTRLLRHVAHERMDLFLSDLRYAYRLGAQAKLRYLSD